YQITDVLLTPRCPQCAAELESEDAVICLNCGYNNRTRVRMSTVHTIAYTPLDWIVWLGPGILSFLAALAMLGVIAYLWTEFRRKYNDEWYGFPTEIWGSVVACGIGWVAGRWAFKRLILNFRPPEKLKRESGGLR